jgi:Domain of unknown function (DUF4157)
MPVERSTQKDSGNAGHDGAHDEGGHQGKGVQEANAAGSDALLRKMAGGGGGSNAGPGKRIGVPFIGEMEHGYNHSFADVTVEVNPEATRERGVKAFTQGRHITVDNENPAREVIAHELAHVVQQSGGQPGGGAGGDHEAEADQAAHAVLGGKKVEGLGAAPHGVQAWAGGDHYALGNAAGQKALARFRAMFPGVDPAKAGVQTAQKTIVGQKAPGSKEVEGKQGETIQINTGGGKGISMGAASRFSGDHLAQAGQLKGQDDEMEVAAGGAVNAVAGVIHVDPHKLNMGFEKAAMGIAASTNSNHFYPVNRMEYAGHHQKALALAKAGDHEAAMMEEGFAGHFLQDTHASGHMAPRSLDSVEHMHSDPHLGNKLQNIWKKVTGVAETAHDGKEGLMRSRQWHDFFCMLPNGLPTNQGRFHGDSYMDGNDLAHVSDIVADSMTEVMAATQGKGVSYGVQARIPVPNVGEILADPVAGPAWRIMQGEYAADLAKGEHDIKDGDKGTSDGGTQFDSKEVLRDIEQNVMAGAQKKPVHGDSLASWGDTADKQRKTLSDTMGGLNHYLTAGFHINENLNGKDGFKKQEAEAHSERWDVVAIEDKFKMITNLAQVSQDYRAALQGYQGELAKAGLDGNTTAKAQAQVERELAIADKLAQQAANWSKRVAQVKGMLGGVVGDLRAIAHHPEADREALRNEIVAALEPLIPEIGKMLPLPKGNPKDGSVVAKSTTPGGTQPRVVDNM